jgi:hypothetical protein
MRLFAPMLGALRRAQRRRPVVLAVIVAVVVLGVVHVRPHSYGFRPAALHAGTFKIAGSIGGLYPGDKASLLLKVTNPQRYAIVITSISTAVSSARPGCASSNLTVAPFAGKLRVRARAAAQVAVEATMLHAAPNACQGAVFHLSYHGLGRKA